MLVVGLTGGIGAGKSTFAVLLAERGAQIIDADALGRDALKTGAPTWHAVVEQFGDEILAPHSMAIDRKILAGIVFNDDKALAALNAIVHPVIMKGVADRLEMLSVSDEVVVLDAALILEAGLVESVDVLVVVTADDGVREQRLASDRGMTLSDIRARMASQMDPESLLKRADIVVDNSGTVEDLVPEADRVWAELERLARR
nr:dephospho-CoA kinase [Actinomycetota bacterium]